MVWPGHIKPGTLTDALVNWTDILPTLLEITGCKTPEGLDGNSFSKVLYGKSSKHREYIFTTHSGDGKMNVYPIRSVRSERFKYIRNLRPDCYHSNHSDILRKPNAGTYWNSWDETALTDARAVSVIHKYYVRPPEEFYDILNDPFEQQNLIKGIAHGKQIKKMRQLLDNWMKEQGDSQTVFESPYPVSGPRPNQLGIKE